MRCFVLLIVLSCVEMAVAPAGFARANAPTAFEINPPVLKVGTFFPGGEVTIEGEVPASEDVVVEIVGSQVNSVFDVKGRVGPFWMTREKVDLEHAPALYFLLLPSGPDWVQKAAALNLGIDHLKQQFNISRSEAAPEDIFQMFLKLKRSEKLYGEEPGTVSYSAGKNGRRRFTATCRLPSSIAAGRYTVKVTPIAHGVSGRELSGTLMVQEVGFVKMVNELATNRRLIYGITAVVIALLAGALMGIIFKGGGRH